VADAGVASLGAGPGGGSTGDDSAGPGSRGGDAPTSGERFDVPADGTAAPGETDGEACAGVSETAAPQEVPADIFIVIDNSSSMGDEANGVQNNLNAFSQQIDMSGIDHHVVLLSALPSDEAEGVCIDPPLGSGGCPTADENLPVFRHIPQDISSNSALHHLLEYADDWMASVRNGSAKHVVVVTDDCSDLPVDEFHASFTGLGKDFEDYRFHAIIDQSGCGECSGAGYVWLAEQSDGLIADLCNQDFSEIFDALSTEVIETNALSCQWVIPPPPDGEHLDPHQVNVFFDDGSGPVAVGRVDAADECAAVADGWYYDDPVAPAEILACPQTCERIQGVTDGTIEIQFGCETMPAA
jgi:hypothetical protein